MNTTVDVIIPTQPVLAPSRQHRGLLTAGLAAVVLALALIGFAGGTAIAVGIPLAVMFGLVVVRLAMMERRRWGSWAMASPLTLIAVSWWFFFGLLSLGGYHSAKSDPRLGNNEWLIGFAVAVTLVSVLLIAVGYYLALTACRSVTGRQSMTASSSRHKSSVKPLPLMISFTLGWLGRLYLIESGTFGYLSGQQVSSGPIHRSIQMAALLLPLGLAVTVAVGFGNRRHGGLSRRTARALLVFNLLPLVATALGSGMKAQLIVDLTPAGLAYLITRGRIPWRAVALAVLYLIVVLPGVEQYRSDLNAGTISGAQRSGVINATVNAGSRVVSQWASSSPVHNTMVLWDHFTSEYSAIALNLAVILHRTPEEVPFLGNDRQLAELLFFLPGSLVGRGDFNVYVYTNTTYLGGTSTSSSPPTQPGDFYMSGGWVTLLIGEVVVGAFLGVIWFLFMTRSRGIFEIAVYAVVAASFVNAGLEWTTLSRTVLQTLVFIVPLAALVAPPRERSIAADLDA